MKRTVLFLFLAVVCLCTSAVGAQSLRPEPGLTVVNGGPQGEVASLAEANEIRIVFSEPMVALGRIPGAQPAFFKIEPAVPGAFRWSGTTILIFTPDARRPLALATTYKVTIGAGAAAESGRKLERPFTLTFTTPTVRLLGINWYRRGDRFDDTLIVALRFNQPVSPSDVLAHLTARFGAHPWTLTDLEALRTRLRSSPAGQQAVDRLDAKVAAARAAGAATGPVAFALASEWDEKQFPPAPDLVVIEAVTSVPPESWVTIALDAQIHSPAGGATPGKVQDYTIKVEPAFFIEQFHCDPAPDPGTQDTRDPRPKRKID